MFGVGGGILSHLSMSALHDIMDGEREVAFALAVSNIGTGCGIIGVSSTAAYFTNVNHILSLDQLFRYMSLLGAFVTLVAIIVFSIISKNLEMKEYDNPHDDDSESESRRAKKIESSEATSTETATLLSDQVKGSPCRKKFGWILLFSKEGFETKATYLFVSQIIGIAFTIIPFKFS